MHFVYKMLITYPDRFAITPQKGVKIAYLVYVKKSFAIVTNNRRTVFRST